MAAQDRPPRLAVLIDAENVSAKIADTLFEQVAALGEANVRRIYGDFSGGKLKCWLAAITKHGIVPQHTSACAAGKNAADIALVIDAMDLLHTGRFDGFCLVSSDSDFTRLATRIRETGADVYGFGEAKTPASFRQACLKFVDVGTFGAGAAETGPVEKKASVIMPASDDGAAKLSPRAAIPFIEAALGLDPSDDWQALSAVGGRLLKLSPNFSYETFGCTTLSILAERSEGFDIRRNDNKTIDIRTRAARAA